MSPCKKFRFDLSARKGCSIQSFTLKETTGLDEENAALAAKAKGGAATVFEELVRLSLVMVNDQPVEPPFGEYDVWNSRTRAFVLQAYRSINGVDEKEVADFLSGGQPQ
jgi:hypothetical protein